MYVRFEERDVHIVHAQLKPGQRHLYASRTFYLMDDDLECLFIMDAYDDNQDLMRHQCIKQRYKGNMGGIEGLGDTECNVQGEFTFDFATRTYTGTNQFGPGLSTGQLFIMVKKKPVSFLYT